MVSLMALCKSSSFISYPFITIWRHPPKRSYLGEPLSVFRFARILKSQPALSNIHAFHIFQKLLMLRIHLQRSTNEPFASESKINQNHPKSKKSSDMTVFQCFPLSANPSAWPGWLGLDGAHGQFWCPGSLGS